MIQNLNSAKKRHGGIPVRFLKVLVTGSGATGKTSFVNLLLNKKFNASHHSTKLVHAKHAVSVKTLAFHGSPYHTDKIKWIEMDNNLEIGFMRSVISSSRKSPVPVATTSPKSVNRGGSFHIPKSPGKSKSITSRQNESILKRFVTGIYTPPVKNSNLSAINTMLLTTSNSDISHKPGEVLNMITVLDTGGQPEYIHLLPTINIYPTVTFVVHDLTKSLDDQVLVEYSQHGKHMFAPYHLNYSNMDMIRFLISAANDAVERPPSKFPSLIATPCSSATSYICLVGTHADKASQIRINRMGNQLTSLACNTECKAAVWQREDGCALFPVDNTTAGKENEDPVAEELRCRIEMVAEERDVFDFPITWMLLQLEIQQVCSDREKSYITFEECVSIAKKSNLIASRTEVKTMLLYYHLLRVLIYFANVDGLCDYVIVDHQWWFDKLSYVITSTFQQAQMNIRAVHRLKYSGILSKELLQCIKWEDDIKEQFFLSLLVHMKIIASIVTGDITEEQYFIPFVLPAYSSQMESKLLPQYGCLQGKPLLVQFRSRLLPRGFFCSLIVELLQNPPQEWYPHLSQEEETHHTYINLITFCLPNAFSFSLFDKVSYLEVQIRHPDEAFPASIHNQAYSELVRALIQTCCHLNFDYSGIQYGFLCDCKKVSRDHIATIPTLSETFKFAKCDISTVYNMRLDSTHLVWFSKEQIFIDGTLVINVNMFFTYLDSHN